MPLVIDKLVEEATKAQANTKDITTYRMPSSELQRAVMLVDFKSKARWWRYRKMLELMPELESYNYAAL